MAFCPPSVSHAAPSGATMTPCGAEPRPSGICSCLPDLRIETGRARPCAGRSTRQYHPMRGRDIVRIGAWRKLIVCDLRALLRRHSVSERKRARRRAIACMTSLRNLMRALDQRVVVPCSFIPQRRAALRLSPALGRKHRPDLSPQPSSFRLRALPASRTARVVLRKSIRNSAAANASPRCADAVTTSTILSPGTSRP